MRVNNPSVSEVHKAYHQVKKVVEKHQQVQRNPDDGIELSPEARFYSAALQALRDLSESDGGKLQKLQESLKNGTYRISNQDIAEKIYQENFLDKTR